MFDHLQLLNHLSIGIAIIDPELRFVYWNKWLAEHSLISDQAVEGRAILDVFPNLREIKFSQKLKQVFESGQPIFLKKKAHANPFPFYSGRSYIEKQLAPMQQTVIISPLKDRHGITAQALITVFDISDWISNQKTLLESKEKMELLSQTDDLTQIPNRRNILDRLAVELRTHTRKKRPMSIAMLDIDHFKRINDDYGHQCGDMVLHETAQLMTMLLREYDWVGRYGGEEFLIILPEATSDQSLAICNRLRIALQDHAFRYEDRELHLTVSIGIAARGGAENIGADKLIAEADRCLYIAKETGRNRTERQT
jgi:diguanylate cyclase (GGDEF)-like protein